MLITAGKKVRNNGGNHAGNNAGNNEIRLGIMPTLSRRFQQQIIAKYELTFSGVYEQATANLK